MRFETKKDTVTTILKIHERKLDASISPELKGEFLLLAKPKMKILIIDLSEVEFCDSTGLSALLIAARKMRERRCGKAGRSTKESAVTYKNLAFGQDF